MVERIDSIVYAEPTLPSTKERLETSLYATGPAEFLCIEIAAALLATDAWSALFGDYIDGYKRMDYPFRALPALRIYNDTYVKSYESWFIEGNIKCDLIFPANIRRKDLEQIPDTVSAALLQQFRRPGFFAALCVKVPGLNELGKRFDVDKSLAFEMGGDDLCPLTQILVNFKLDLRQWDLYLESDDRTIEDPFERTLGDLESIATVIHGLNDDDTTGATVVSEQTIDDA